MLNKITEIFTLSVFIVFFLRKQEEPFDPFFNNNTSRQQVLPIQHPFF